MHVECCVWPSFCGCNELYSQLPGLGAHGEIGSLPIFCSLDSLTSPDLRQGTGKPGPFSEAPLPWFCSLWAVDACREGPQGVRANACWHAKECGSSQGGPGGPSVGLRHVPGVIQASLFQRHLAPLSKAMVRVKHGTGWRSNIQRLSSSIRHKGHRWSPLGPGGGERDVLDRLNLPGALGAGEHINQLGSSKSAMDLTGPWSPRRLGLHSSTAEDSRPPWSGRKGPGTGNATSGLDPWQPHNVAVPSPILL